MSFESMDVFFYAGCAIAVVVCILLVILCIISGFCRKKNDTSERDNRSSEQDALIDFYSVVLTETL